MNILSPQPEQSPVKEMKKVGKEQLHVWRNKYKDILKGRKVYERLSSQTAC